MSLCSFKDLQDFFGCKRASMVERCLNERGIRYMKDADLKPITTVKFINEAMERGGNRRKRPNIPVNDRGMRA